MEEVRICPSCQAEMKLRYDGVLFMKTSQISPSPDCISVELYRCPRCRQLEWVEPLTAVEEFEKDQAEMEAVEDPVKKFEIIFRGYSERQLRKVIDGKGYVEEAKKAAQNLLRRIEK